MIKLYKMMAIVKNEFFKKDNKFKKEVIIVDPFLSIIIYIQ